MFISPPIKEKKQKMRTINILKPIKKNLRNILFVALPLLIFLIKILLVILFTSAAPASSMARYQTMHNDIMHQEHKESYYNGKFFGKFQLKTAYQLLQDEDIFMNN